MIALMAAVTLSGCSAGTLENTGNSASNSAANMVSSNKKASSSTKGSNTASSTGTASNTTSGAAGNTANSTASNTTAGTAGNATAGAAGNTTAMRQYRNGAPNGSADRITPAKQLAEIRRRTLLLTSRAQSHWLKNLAPQLLERGVRIVRYTDLSEKQRRFLDGYFRNEI